MTSKLTRMRDELAEKTALAIRNVTPHGSPLPGTHNTCVQSYRAGFTAAHDLLMPVIEEMRAALEYHTHSDDVGYPNDNVIEALEKAREILE